MNIVLICPSGAVAEAISSLELDTDDSSHTTVVVAAASELTADGFSLIRLGPASNPVTWPIARQLDRSVIGRNLKRVTPMDNGHRFARAAGKNADFRTATGAADLIIALERDAILAAWKAIRRWDAQRARGVYGLAPGRAVLSELRKKPANHERIRG